MTIGDRDLLLGEGERVYEDEGLWGTERHVAREMLSRVDSRFDGDKRDTRRPLAFGIFSNSLLAIRRIVWSWNPHPRRFCMEKTAARTSVPSCAAWLKALLSEQGTWLVMKEDSSANSKLVQC